jgi:hypothetical protein
MIRNILGIVMLAAIICGTSLAFTIDGNFDDWADVTAQVDDDEDMADSSGDIKMVQAAYEDGNLYLRMVVYGIITPAVADTPAGMENRYYYHWLIDTDNDLRTGFENSAYEGNPTDVDPIGVDVVVQVGWRDGAAEADGVYAYDPITEEEFVVGFEFASAGDSMEAVVSLNAIGIEGVQEGQKANVSAFQEGASDDWAVDWLDPAVLVFIPIAVEPGDRLATTWAGIKRP